jgi:hypothetical protein
LALPALPPPPLWVWAGIIRKDCPRIDLRMCVSLWSGGVRLAFLWACEQIRSRLLHSVSSQKALITQRYTIQCLFHLNIVN